MKPIQSKEFINKFYKHVSGFTAYESGQIEELQKQQIYPTYGEILYDSIAKIITNLDLTKKDIFYDLGSGVGKIVVQFFLDTPIKKACGIEALESRHKQAIKAYNFIKKANKQLLVDRELIFHHGNILQHNIEDASIIFMNSLCFSDSLMQGIKVKINNSKDLKYIISNSNIPANIMPNKIELTIESSWSDCSRFYIYSKK